MAHTFAHPGRPPLIGVAHKSSIRPAEWALLAISATLAVVPQILNGANSSVLGLALAAMEAFSLVAVLAVARFAGELWAQRHSLYIAALLYFLVIVVAAHPLYLGNTTHQEDQGLVRNEILKLLGLGSIFIVGCIVGENLRRAEILIILVSALIGIYALVSIIAFKTLLPDPLTDQTATFSGRLTGTFGSPNSLATLLGLGVIMNLSLAVRPSFRRPKSGPLLLQKPLAVAFALTCGAALMMTASRGGFIATILALLPLGFFTMRARGKPFKIIALSTSVLFGVTLALIFLASPLGERIFQTTLKVDRVDIIRAHSFVLSNNILWGLGAGNIEQINNLAINGQNYPILWNIRALHNVYGQWLEEYGAVCLILIASSISVILLNVTSSLRSTRASYVGAMTLASSALILVHGLSDYAMQVPSLTAIWALMLGIGSGVGEGVRAKRGVGRASQNRSAGPPPPNAAGE